LITASLVTIVPSLVGQWLHGDGIRWLMALVFYGSPSMIAIALFGRADRRSPMLGALIAVLAFLLLAIVADDTPQNAMPEHRLVYCYLPLLSFPLAVVAGYATWGADALFRRVADLYFRDSAKAPRAYR
jgi:hypothetical protein